MLMNVLDILATTPEKIRREISALSRHEMKTCPRPGKWSIQLILAHLDDVEEIGMRARVEAMVSQDQPMLEPFDQEKRVIEMRYDRRDPWQALESFARQRRRNVRWLRTLKPSDLKRPGRHKKVGKITAAEMIHEWAFHDLGHLKQIMEVKRYALWPDMGNMRKFYHLT